MSSDVKVCQSDWESDKELEGSGMLGLKHVHGQGRRGKGKLGGRGKRRQTEDCDMKLASMK